MSDRGATGPLEPASVPAPVPGPDALARATRALREAPEPGWGDVADRVRTRLRTVSRPGRPLTVREDRAGVVQVDTRVVVDAVRRAVTSLPGTRPVAVDVVAAGTRAVSVRIEVAVRFGSDVHAAADAVRDRTREVVKTLLGAPRPVDVMVVDVMVVDVTVVDVTAVDVVPDPA